MHVGYGLTVGARWAHLKGGDNGRRRSRPPEESVHAGPGETLWQRILCVDS